MKEPSDARKRTLELQNRATTFSANVNHCYPSGQLNAPSETVWRQLVRAADSQSNNLIEAEDASSDADFLHKMRTTLREVKESRNCLKKIRLGPLANAKQMLDLGLEQEADELAAIYATIIINRERNIARGKPKNRPER